MNWSKESLIEVLSTTARSIADEAHTISPNFDQDVIHHFRVQTKKLRALLRLIQTEDPELDIRLSKSFKKLYALSGEIRDAQVQLGRATKLCDPPLPDYTVWLAQEMANAETEFNAFYDVKVVRKLAKKLKKLDVPEISSETLQQYFQDHMEETVVLLLKEPLDDEDLHTLRKRVKDLQHVAKVCSEVWPEGAQAIGDSASLKTLEKLTDLAGDYNDQHMALLSLERYMESAEKTKKAEKVHGQWVAAKDEDRVKLLNAIKEFNGTMSGEFQRDSENTRGK
jgi:CHAD domain-containing protein